MSYRLSTFDRPRRGPRITIAHAVDGAHQMAMGLGYALAGMILGVAMSVLIHQI